MPSPAFAAAGKAPTRVGSDRADRGIHERRHDPSLAAVHRRDRRLRGDTACQTIDTSVDSFEAIILDLLLPVVSGFEILERIRRANPELLRRVVVVTAASGPRVEKISGTARSFIRKPFDLDDLVSAVLQCVNERGAADPTTAGVS
jgi:CheY-like chemotaxis protein